MRVVSTARWELERLNHAAMWSLEYLSKAPMSEKEERKRKAFCVSSAIGEYDRRISPSLCGAQGGGVEGGEAEAWIKG
jgi:hypothetical protein